VYPRPLAHLPYARRDGGPAAVAARGSKSSASRRWRSASVKPTSIHESGSIHEGGSLVKVLLADFGEAKQLTGTMTRAVGTIACSPVYMCT